VLAVLSAPALAGDPRDAAEPPRALDVVGAEDLQTGFSENLSEILGTLPKPGAMSNGGRVRAGGMLQVRYGLSSRDDAGLGDDETTLGFSLPRAELTLQVEAIESVEVILSGDAGLYGDGDFELQTGVVNIILRDDYAAQIGQFRPAIRREEMVHESRLGGVSRTVLNEFFSTRYHQGIQLAGLRDDERPFAWSAFFTDGPDSSNTGFESPDEYDYSLGGRLEFMPFGSWRQFVDVTSFRGSDPGLLLGAGAWYASRGETNPSSFTDQNLCGLSLDANYEADGWRLGGAFDWLREDTDGQPTFDFYGAGVEGGVFVAPQFEIFGRVEHIWLDDDLLTSTDEFLFATFGVNHYVVPDSHAFKISADVVLSLDETSALTGFGATNQGPVGPGSVIGLQGSSEDNEILFRLQVQAVF
jgi:hypothetical protein